MLETASDLWATVDELFIEMHSFAHVPPKMSPPMSRWMLQARTDCYTSFGHVARYRGRGMGALAFIEIRPLDAEFAPVALRREEVKRLMTIPGRRNCGACDRGRSR